VNATFNHYLLEFIDLNPERLRDTDGLSALVVAAAGAVGMPGLGPPVAREGAGDIAVALLCLEGHIVLHCAPDEGVCLVDIVARASSSRSGDVAMYVARAPARPRCQLEASTV